MSAGEHLSPQQFRDSLSVQVTPGYVAAKHPKHGYVGELTYHEGTHEVLNVDVPPEHQRKGVATAMWNAARSQGIDLQHSATRTPEGDVWARSIGGPLPSQQRVEPDSTEAIHPDQQAYVQEMLARNRRAREARRASGNKRSPRI